MIKIPPLDDSRLRSKAYTYFRGCDFTTDPAEIDDTRSPDSLNMIADDAGFPEKRVGWRVMTELTGKIHSMIFAHFAGVTNPVIVVHHGTKLTAYDYTANTKSVLSTGMNDHASAMFLHAGKLYVLDGAKYQRFYYASGYQSEEVKTVAKTPTTGRNGHYTAEDDGHGNITYTWEPCTQYEEPNLLSSSQINELAGDGANKDFWLTEQSATVTKVEQYSSGSWSEIASTAYTVTDDTTVGKTKVSFTTAPAAHPDGAGIDNIRVTFTSTAHPADATQIEKCCIATQYGYFNDNRFFVAGNPDHKHRDYACAVSDPTYWELNQWTDIGSDQTAIMGYLHYGDVLAIVKEDDNQDAEIYIRSTAVQSDNSVLFPVQQGVKGVGAISRGAFASLRDDALFYAREGVFAVAGTDASQQRTVQNRSYFVDNRLRIEANKADAVAVVWENRYLLAFPGSGHCYVADARMQTGMNESYVYEWFYWENIPACAFLEFDGNLFFGTTDGRLCKMNGDFSSMLRYKDNLVRNPTPRDVTLEREAWQGGSAIRAHWTTRADALGSIAHLKTITKRGNTAQVKPYSHSFVSISAITNNADTVQLAEAETNVWDFAELDFEDIDFNAMSTPVVVPFNSKVKKFQIVQLRIENAHLKEDDKPDQGLGLFGIQLQYTVNNYIK
jgi:hypothetical protein